MLTGQSCLQPSSTGPPRFLSDSQIIATVAGFSYSEDQTFVWGGHLEQSLVAQATNSDALGNR